MPGNPAVQFGQLIGFFLFMALVFWVAYNGLDQVKWVQDIGGPILVVVIILLGYWSIDMLHDAGYTVAQAFAQGNDWATIEANGGFAFVYMAGLTANIAFWATMALNIPDFSRYAASQNNSTGNGGQLSALVTEGHAREDGERDTILGTDLRVQLNGDQDDQIAQNHVQNGQQRRNAQADQRGGQGQGRNADGHTDPEVADTGSGPVSLLNGGGGQVIVKVLGLFEFHMGF